MFYKKINILIFLFCLFLSGCSDKPISLDDITGIGDDIADIFGKDDSENYTDSKSIAMLEIPPSLDNPNYNDALRVPKSIDASGQILKMTEAPVLPTYIDMTIIKQGNARWLEIQTDPVSLWPYLSQFWISQGYEIKIDEPINGILETNWKKYEINFDSETKLIKNEDFNYNASKEKFRVRVEREPNGFSNIYLSNQIMEADDVVNGNKILWKKKNSDILREAEMLVRIMEFLGTSREGAIESLNNSEKNNEKLYIDLIDFNGIPAILIKDSFSKLWREIGLSLDRSGLVVQDHNRDKLIYTISSSKITGKEKAYEIKLTNRGDRYLVTAHNSNTIENISYKDARIILKHIISAYNPIIAKK